MPQPRLARRLAASALALALAAPGAAADPALVDGIAAQVGTEVVLLSEVNRVADPVLAQLREAGAGSGEVARLRADVLESLIERRLVALFAKRAEIEATPAEIDQAVAAIAEENGISPETLRQSVEAQGLEFDAYRARLGQEIVQQKVLGAMVRPRVHVDEAEVRALYQQRYADQPEGGEEVRIRHLVVAAADDKPASLRAACARVRAAHERIRAGEPFLQVARDVSQVEPELGWIHRRSLAPWMLEVLAELEPGQSTGVVELPFGCNLLQLVDQREYQRVGYEEAKPTLERRLFEEKLEAEYRRFLEKLRAQTYIERRGLFAEAARIDLKKTDAAQGKATPKP